MNLYQDSFSRDPDGRYVPCLNHQLIDLWIFGDKYSMPTLYTAAVDAIIDQYVNRGMMTTWFDRV